MRGFVTFSCVLIAVLVSSSPGAAAPTSVTFALTGGNQTMTPNRGPIETGTLAVSVNTAGCQWPPDSGPNGCLHTLTFQTTQGQTFAYYDFPFTYNVVLSSYGPGHARYIKLTQLMFTPSYGARRQHLAIYQTPAGQMNNVGHTNEFTYYTSTLGFSHFGYASPLTGAEVGYPPPLPLLGTPTRILLAAMMLCIPLLLTHRSRRAAGLNHRRS